MTKNPKIGVIGVGHLAMALLEGWRRSGLPAEEILLSPRGHGRGAAMAHGHALARDNVDLVRRVEIIFLAVRPAHAEAALSGLPWRRGQIIVSACAGVSIATLQKAAPEAEICRIMPLTAAAIGASPTTCHPLPPEVEPLLARLGPVIPLAAESAFEVATVSAAVYGWALELIATSAAFAQANGLPAETARALNAATFTAAGRLAGQPGADLSLLLSELVTPGGITERGLDVLSAGAVPETWTLASQAVLDKLTR